MGIIDRYVLRLYVKVLLICFASLTGLFVVIDALNNLDDLLNLGKQQGSLPTVFCEYYGARSLAFFDRTSALIALVAATFAVTSMQRSNELCAVMAAGIPKIRVVAPLLAGAAIVVTAAMVLALAQTTRRLVFVGFALAILITGWSLVEFRELHGTVWLFWLVFVVVVTDIMGYFGGKVIGGRKFWPAISPKKTWAGIVAGWLAAGALGAAFLAFTRAGSDLIWISMLTAFASQMGDIAESALKRHVGVKDSSSLIPGHGGLMDRFDGLIGATLFMMLTALIVDVPEVKF
jgi:phosphatidate cytidylyltransferase